MSASAIFSPSSTPSPVTVSAWTQLMGDDLLHVDPASADLSRPVSDVQLYDPLDEQAVMRNAILLVTGIACRSADFERMLVRAASGEAAAVLVKARGTPIEELHAASVDHAMPVIVVRDDADWTRLAALARTAVAGAAADSLSGVRLGDMFAFANAVATMTNGATSIVDPTGHVVGYSTIPGQAIDDLRRETTLTLQERTLPALDAEYKVVYSLSTAVFVESHNDEGARLAIAVRAGGELLGSIWVVDPGDERRQDALDALNRLAPLAGLHMLHARSAADFTERRNADLMRTLMDDARHAPFAAAQLGLGSEYTHGFAVAAFTIAHPQPGSVDAIREQQRLRQLVTVTCNLQFHSAYNALIDSVVYAVLPCSGQSFRAAHRRLIQDIGGYTSTISAHPIVATVGGVAEGLNELPRSRTEAVRTLNYLLHQLRAKPAPQPPVTGLHEDHSIELNLLEIGDYIAEHDLGRLDVIEAIRSYDADHQTDFLITLRAYLDANGNIAKAAKQLHVHGNTIRYRIARLAEDFQIDLEKSATRLWLWLRLASQRD
jgi:PucR C-terminal helix-turn-helix domain/GGDEF-like domain